MPPNAAGGAVVFGRRGQIDAIEYGAAVDRTRADRADLDANRNAVAQYPP